MIPVHVKVRSLGESGAVIKERDLNFNVFVHQKWTPFLMYVTLDEFPAADECVRRRRSPTA